MVRNTLHLHDNNKVADKGGHPMTVTELSRFNMD